MQVRSAVEHRGVRDGVVAGIADGSINRAPVEGVMGASTHTYGGTRMGDNPKTNVVDRFGFCHDAPNLRSSAAQSWARCIRHPDRNRDPTARRALFRRRDGRRFRLPPE